MERGLWTVVKSALWLEDDQARLSKNRIAADALSRLAERIEEAATKNPIARGPGSAHSSSVNYPFEVDRHDLCQFLAEEASQALHDVKSAFKMATRAGDVLRPARFFFLCILAIADSCTGIAIQELVEVAVAAVSAALDHATAPRPGPSGWHRCRADALHRVIAEAEVRRESGVEQSCGSELKLLFREVPAHRGQKGAAARAALELNPDAAARAYEALLEAHRRVHECALSTPAYLSHHAIAKILLEVILDKYPSMRPAVRRSLLASFSRVLSPSPEVPSPDEKDPERVFAGTEEHYYLGLENSVPFGDWVESYEPGIFLAQEEFYNGRKSMLRCLRLAQKRRQGRIWRFVTRKEVSTHVTLCSNHLNPRKHHAHTAQQLFIYQVSSPRRMHTAFKAFCRYRQYCSPSPESAARRGILVPKRRSEEKNFVSSRTKSVDFGRRSDCTSCPSIE